MVDNIQAIVVRNYILGSFTLYDLCFRPLGTLQIMRKSYTQLSNQHEPPDKLKGLAGVKRWIRTYRD